MSETARSNNATATYGRKTHVLAVLTACMVFPLLFVGASVTSKDAGMAYPDGFVSDGHFVTNPPGWWSSDDTRWEHGHRLLGRTVGLLAIAVVIMCWPRSPVLRVASLVTLLMIIAQGLLGAFRVNQISTLFAMIHAIFGQLCFCMACATAMLASRGWHTATDPDESKSTAFSRRLVVGVVGLVFIQLVFGAALRHFGSDHALAAHVLWAIVVAFAVGWLVLWYMAHYPRQVMLVRLAQIMGTLLAVQLMLGGFAYLATYMADYMSAFIQWVIPSLHVAVGALLLVTAVLLAMCSFRLLRPSARLADDIAEGRLVST